jgi:hypothetical protein
MRKVSDQNLKNLKIPFFRTWGPLQGSIEIKHNNLYLLSTKRKKSFETNIISALYCRGTFILSHFQSGEKSMIFDHLLSVIFSLRLIYLIYLSLTLIYLPIYLSIYLFTYLPICLDR